PQGPQHPDPALAAGGGRHLQESVVPARLQAPGPARRDRGDAGQHRPAGGAAGDHRPGRGRGQRLRGAVREVACPGRAGPRLPSPAAPGKGFCSAACLPRSLRIVRDHRRLIAGADNENPIRETTMGKLSIISTAIVVACVAGCGDRPTTTTDTATAPPAPPPPKPAPPVPVDPEPRRFDCQADTAVVVLNDTARVSLPGGERYTLQKIADSDPEVYIGDSLYFTLGADAAHLSQQDGM